jgi:RHS repeat-associated protein
VIEDNPKAKFTKTLTYDGYNRVLTETNEAKNKSNNLTQSKIITNVYAHGQVEEIKVGGNSVWKVTDQDARGHVTTALLGTALKQTNTYDSYGLPQNFLTEKLVSGSPPVSLMELGYSFNATTGNLTSRTNSAFNPTPGNPLREDFTYDDLDRLSTYNETTGPTNRTQNYDARGRITSNGQVGSYTYSGTSYQQSGLTNLSDFAKYHYQNRPLQQISYNSFKAPVTINENGRERIDFEYNGAEQRSHMYYGDTTTDKTMRPMRRHYSEDGSMEITEDLPNSKTSFVFYLGGDAYSAPAIWKYEQTGSTVNTNSLLYLLRDHLGSITMITDASGAILEKRRFDAWGNIVQTGGSLVAFSIIDRGYTGHEHLQGIGLINMNARLYDPILHRFLGPDDLIQDPYDTQSYNRYAYVLNNPLKYIDPSGNKGWPWQWFKKKDSPAKVRKEQDGSWTLAYPNPKSSGGSDGGGGGFSGASSADQTNNDLTKLSYWTDWKAWLNAAPIINGVNRSTIDLDNGNYGSAAFNYGSAVLDVFAVESLFKLGGSAANSISRLFTRNTAKTGAGALDGSFSIFSWKGYPAEGIKPTGTFRLLEGAEYSSARSLANSTNLAMRKANPEMFKGLQIHEINPVKFGGSPTDLANKIFLTPSQHAQYTNFWNSLLRSTK